MSTKKQEEKQIRITTYRPEGAKRTYSNHVEVAISPHDVSLKFCDIMPPSQDEVEQVIKENNIRVPVLHEIVLSHKVAKSLIDVLKKQLDKVEEKEGKT